jgi:hypothetical protein
MRKLIFSIALLPLATPALAGGYGGVQASAQAGVFAAPQSEAYVVPSQPAVQQQVIERQFDVPAQYENVVVQRQVSPARTIIQREIVQQDVQQDVCYAPAQALRSVAYAPARQFATVGNSCGVGAQALANVGYSSGGAAFAPARGLGLRAPRLFGQRGRIKTKAKSKTIQR